MKRPLFALSLATVASLASLAVLDVAHAGGTKERVVSGYDELDEGEAKGVAVEGRGALTIGYDDARAEVAGVRSVFSCTRQGGRILLGTADKATVQAARFGPKGKAPTVEKIAELEGVVVSALAGLPNGDVVAATLPGGKLVRIDGKGKVTPFAELPVEQIWALLVHDGKLWVGTGPKGELFTVGLDGKDPKVVLDSEETHLLSLLAIDGKVVVGTSPKALVLQMDGDKLEGLLVHDFEGDEVRRMVRTATGLAVIVNDFAAQDVNSLSNLTQQLDRASLGLDAPTNQSVSGSSPKGTARLVHVDLVGDGKKVDLTRAVEATWETWLEKDKQYFTDLVVLSDRSTMLVAGSDGAKVHRVKGRRDVATVSDLEERITTGLCAGDDGRVLATTGDGAAVHDLRTLPASEPKWQSDVYDAKQPANYGAVWVRGTGVITLRVRSGPNEEPDKRWTDWKTIKLERNGAVLRGALDTAKRRFVQIELGLGSNDAEVRSFGFFYAPENLAPKIKSVDFEAPSFDADDKDEPDDPAKLKWVADALDGDDLTYDVRIRATGGKAPWIPLTRTEPTTKKELEVELSTLPDGVYEAEVVVSDEPANGTGRARTDSLASSPFVVDRTRPSLSGVSVKGRTVTGTASDATSRVHDVAIAVDDGPFRPASPTDGMFDGDREPFEAKLPETLDKGVHRLVVRARDAHGNLVSEAVLVTIE